MHPSIQLPESFTPVKPQEPLVITPWPPRDLPETDGEPLESNWHRLAINLLIECLNQRWPDRNDFFAGGNMFVYFSPQQVRNRDYRGPDVFFAWDVDRHKPRRYWAIWDEGGKFPDVLFELLSPTTAHEDRTTKKALYEQTFQAKEYYLYDPDSEELEGWRRGVQGVFEAIVPDARGWLWSDTLQLWVGKWTGRFVETAGVWLRFFDAQGALVPTGREAEHERAEAEKIRAEAEKEKAEAQQQRAEAAEAQMAALAASSEQRAATAEAEVTRLKARLAELEGKEQKG